VGTTARIVGMQPIGDGRMQVQSLGQRPFKIVQLQQTHPYLKAIIEYLDHDRGDADRLRSLAEAVKEQFLNHLDILAKLMDRQRPEFELDLDPERLSYIVAGSMAVDMPEKQRLLEITAAEERLKTEAAILARENRALQTFMYLRDQQQKGPQGPQDQGPWGRIYTN
jgi:Lon protease-like protein